MASISKVSLQFKKPAEALATMFQQGEKEKLNWPISLYALKFKETFQKHPTLNTYNSVSLART